MSAPLAKPRPRPDSYEQDYFAWTVAQGRLLRDLRPAELDWENLAEEIESLGRSDKRRIASNLNVILTHLLKWRHQPAKRKGGWKSSIAEHRSRLNELIADSPSLRRHPRDILKKEYLLARLKAADETGLPENAFPEECPFTIEEILDSEFWPEA